MKLTSKQIAIIEKFIAENIYDGKQVDFSNEMLEQIYKELKGIGIPANKTFLKKVFATLIEKYDSDSLIKKEIKKKESCTM